MGDTSKNRYQPRYGGLETYNSFNAVMQKIFKYKGKSETMRFSKKDLSYMWGKFAPEWRTGLKVAQEEIYRDMHSDSPKLDVSSKEKYMGTLAHIMTHSGADFYKKMETDVPAWWKEIGSGLRAGRGISSTPDIEIIPQDARASIKAAPPLPAAKPGALAPGTYLPGLGRIGPTGQLTRGGITHNLGGGEVDTKVQSTSEGDTVILGGDSVSTATKNLRTSFVIAGGEHVRPDDQANLQSDAIFESFSWEPDGFFLGPNNQLHLQNKQNEAIRFGMEPLSAPRMSVDTNMPHNVPMQWMEHMDNMDISNELAKSFGMEIIHEEAFLHQEREPFKVLDNDYNQFDSSKELPRQTRGPSPFHTVVDNHSTLYPAFDPSGYVMDSVGFQNSLSGTFSNRRLNIFGT